MELKLAKNEKIIKEYFYSTRAQKGFGGKKNTLDKRLIITNKRVINEAKSSLSVIRKEVPIEACDYIMTSFSKQARSLLGAIVCLIIGIIGAIAYFIVEQNYVKLGALGVGVLFLIIGIILLISFFMKKNASVEVIIAGKMEEHNLLSVGSSNMSSSRKIAKRIKLIVDRKTSEIMINEIGALLLDVKSGVSLEPEKEEIKEMPAFEKKDEDFVEAKEDEVIEEEITEDEGISEEVENKEEAISDELFNNEEESKEEEKIEPLEKEDYAE